MAVWNKLTGTGIVSEPGVDPTVAYGPVPAAGVSGQGVVLPAMRVGSVFIGDLGTEWILVKLVLAAATDLIPGQVYTFDRDYTATLLPVSNTATLNAEAGAAMIYASQLAIGTYYVWLARAGHVGLVTAAASTANGGGEASGTAGVMKFLAAPTATNKGVVASSIYVASAGFTFTASTVNGSPTLTNLSSSNDLVQGALIAGTGIPANANIQNIRRGQGGGYVIDMGTSTAGNLNALQNATVTSTGPVTVTVTGTLPGNLAWPTIKQN